MSVPFPEWLSGLGTRRADLPVSEQVRGLPIGHTYTYPGNVTTATLEGQVKSSPDAVTPLVPFTIGSPTFSSGVTIWPISLTGVQTAALPVDDDANGVEYFLYDLVLTLSGGAPQRVAGGLFPISGQITEPA